jgi:hypothetical protein
MCRSETKVVRHLVLQGFDLRGKELDNLAALGTDHMIVMGVIIMMLVICLVVPKSYLTGKAGLGEQL